jgi:hypothetical protein
MNQRLAEITVFEKIGGVLSKRIWLDSEGKVCSDGSACVMTRGSALRLRIADVSELAAMIEKIRPNEALALGALRADLPEKVHIVTKSKLNGQPNTIARTASDIHFRKERPAYALTDFDTKGMPPEVAERMQQLGGFWPSLVGVLPILESAEHVIRRSTSTGLYRTDTGNRLPGSGGLHGYLKVVDGADLERFVRALHERCWLAGLGWMMVGAGGQLLERSIVDRMVGAPERLIFEADPILDPPLAQDRESRRPMPVDGAPLDTITACPPLTIVETAKLRALKAKEAQRLAPESATARTAYVAAQAKRLAQRTGLSEQAAAEQVTRRCEGVLLPDAELPFDDDEFAGCTVNNVLADPERFEGATLSDPLEGIDYGRCKARIMRRADGAPWIHSFAHGRTVYELKHNARTVRAAMDAVADDAVVRTFLKLTLAADLGDDELEHLRNEAAKRSGLTKRTISQMLKAARQEQAAKRRREERQRHIAERDDPRPSIRVPDEDAPWLPQMQVLNDVIAVSTAAHPLVRDIDGTAAYANKAVMPTMHLFTTAGANTQDEEQDHSLPAPEQWLIRRMNEMQLAEAIERHIDFVDQDGRSVHLWRQFVRHYVQRDDGVLPTMVAVATLPLVLGDGSVLTSDGFNRLRGIDFRVQPEVLACVPELGSVADNRVKAAMRFLTDEWLVDVAANYAGKCIVIAIALTILERSLLDQRPAFFVTAGRRGGGKTTTLTMLIKAITGVLPAAAAWSSNEEERRKALLSYFLYGAPYILWDNIARGTQISCPHIEKSCTAAYYADRKLSVSETIATAASVIHLFTANNIGPRGDLSSRSGLRSIAMIRKTASTSTPIRSIGPTACAP